MIPDFPKEKQKISSMWNQYLNSKMTELTGPMNLAQTYRHYEGNQWQLTRTDKTIDDSNYMEISSNLSIENDEIPKLTSKQIKEKLDKVAEDMASQLMQNVIGKIAQAADSVGNSINANGKPFSPELFLQLLECMDHSFAEDGTWLPPTLIVAPDFMKKNKPIIEGFENDTNFLVKRDSIINRKREEWRDREASRKLVD